MIIMEAEEVKAGNALIAEFMGGVKDFQGRYSIPGYGPQIHINDLKFHTSLDWLKPVIEKIEEWRPVYPEKANKVCNLKIVVGISHQYQAVVKYVKWHTDQMIFKNS